MYEIALAVSVLCYGLVLGYYIRSPLFSVYHPMTMWLAFQGLVFVIRPIIGDIYHYNFMYKAYEFSPSLSDRVTVIYASNLGFLFFSYFCMRFGNVPMRFNRDVFYELEFRRLKQVFIWICIACLPRT